MGASSVGFITGLSITFSGKVGILGVDVPAVLTAVGDDDIAILDGILGVRLGDDFLTLHTNRTFLNTKSQ